MKLCKPVLEDLLGKNIKDNTYVYSWQDPTKDPDYRIGNFLKQSSLQEFEKIYEKEIEMQKKVINEPSKYIFVSELEQLWQITIDQAPPEV